MISPETRLRITEDYKNGMSIKKLSEKYNLVIPQVIKALIISQVIFRKEKFELTSKDKWLLTAYMIRYAYDLQDISDFLKVSMKYIHKRGAAMGDKYFKKCVEGGFTKKRKKKVSKYFSWEEFKDHPLAFYNKD